MRDEIELLRAAEALRASKQARQQAIATFCLKVSEMASQLHKALDIAEHGNRHNKEAQESADYLERRIREEFAKAFGHSMILD